MKPLEDFQSIDIQTWPAIAKENVRSSKEEDLGTAKDKHSKTMSGQRRSTASIGLFHSPNTKIRKANKGGTNAILASFRLAENIYM